MLSIMTCNTASYK